MQVATPHVRARQYADGKPRPLFRGLIHGVLSVGLLLGVTIAGAQSLPELSAGLASKLMTYSASAIFHLYPFETVSGVTQAFVADIALVPCAVVGAALAFITHQTFVREAAIAAAALFFNWVAVVWQTHGQVGLKTRSDRSDAPRTVVVTLYSLWVFWCIGQSVGFGALWGAMITLAVASGLLAIPVGEAHEREPTLRCAFWHRLRVWSLHEDFHLVLTASEACWLVLAMRFQTSGRVPVGIMIW